MKYAVVIIGFFILVVVGVYVYEYKSTDVLISPVVHETQKKKPLLVYRFENLAKTRFTPQQIKWEEKIYSETEDIVSHIVYFKVPLLPDETKWGTVSGLLTAPKKEGIYPVIIMLRGFVPDEEYAPGAGTRRVGEGLAKNGYITLAPDFLGYGMSSPPSSDGFESRFQTYTTVLSLLTSLPNLTVTMKNELAQPNTKQVGIWGHSNGGHIALSVLAITGKPYPTVLWAPVSKPFPYSILFYTDEYEDRGKLLRKMLSRFETEYDVNLFSPDRYYKNIKAPLSLHQGTADVEVPVSWSEELVEILTGYKINIQYTEYAQADHNLQPGWESALQNSIRFYQTLL